MMNNIKKILFTCGITIIGIGTLSAQTGRDIAQRVNDRPDGDSRQSSMVMKLINKRGAVRERKMISYSIDVGKSKKDRKSMMFFESPGDVKGTGFLTWDYDDPSKSDDKWLYLPAMKKTRRISGNSAKKEYFMGSDFTYDDLGKRNVDEDTHTLLGEETLEGQKCWKLQSVPKDNNHIYAKKIVFIRQDCLIPIHVDYLDRDGNTQRKLVVSDISKVGNYWIAKKLHMLNIRNKHETIIEFKNTKFDIPISEDQFNVSTLEKGRF